MIWLVLVLLALLAAWSLYLAAARRTMSDRLRRAEAALDRAQATDAARIRFFANIAHELRTPLTLVLGRINDALVEGDQAKRTHELRVAARHARRLERLADQALELSQLDAGTLRSHPIALDVVPFLESLVMSFEEHAERNGILLEFIARPRSIRYRTDTEQMTTIVSNLLSNAFKFTPPGGRVGVAVEVRTEDDAEHGEGILTITVADTGSGIPAEQLETIFERFQRAEDSVSGRVPGAGIGLALASELVRLQGGAIAVRSEEGRGSRFTVRFPLGHVVVHAEKPPLVTGGGRPEITAEVLYRTTGVDGHDPVEATDPDRPTILIAEDNEDLREWLSEALREDAQVIEAPDGETAIDRARELVPDLVLSDVRMPVLDGIALCRRLRGDERTSHIPIVLMSVRGDVDQRVEGLDAGADDYLAKPTEARELRARVRTLIASRRALRERFREQVVVRPSDVSAQSLDQRFFARVTAAIEERIGDPDFSVTELAEELAMSPSQLTRKLRALVRQSPGQLIRSLRMQRAASLIGAGAGNMAEIAYQVGFSDQAHFSRTFKRCMGCTPVEYRRTAGAAQVS